MISDKLIVALDFDNVADAMLMAQTLKDKVSTFKIGMELGYDSGRDALIGMLKDQGSRIFLDLKLHDIPETVERTVRKIAKSGIDMLTVYGYPDTMYAAARGVADTPDVELYAITVLTSYNEENLRSAGYTMTQRSLVGYRTDHAVLAGLTGVVCGVDDAKACRSFSRGSLKIITPGIRLQGEDKHDQRRAATPAQAVKAGADYLVVGRPVTRSNDPCGMVDRIVADAAS